MPMQRTELGTDLGTGLGGSGISVGRVCLGTMTFGEQNNREEAFRLLDQARAAGVDFLDTAEMYPIPPRAGTCGGTETIIGEWLAARGGRDRVVIATKIAGPGLAHIDRGRPCYGREQIRAAVDGSLRRLHTDYIDLYQLHWPERSTNVFGRRDYRYVPDDGVTPFCHRPRCAG